MSRKVKNIGRNLGMAMVAILVYEIVSQSILGVSAHVLSDESYSNYYMIIDALYRTVLIAIFAIWLYRLYKKEPYEIKPLDLHTLRPVPVIALGLNGLSTVWIVVVTLALKAIPFIEESVQSFNDTWESVRTYSYIWLFVSVVVVGPIVEEFLFRGIVFHYLEKIRVGWFPILVSGIAFGAWHQEPVQCVYTAIIGIGLGIVYNKVRDLKVVCLIHMVYNFFSALPPMLNTTPVLYGVGCLSIIMILPCIKVLARMSKTDVSLGNG